MTEQRHRDDGIHEQDGAGTAMKRRGILAAAGAVVAGIVAKQTAQPVTASQPFLLPNTETTGLSYNVAGPTTITALSTYASAASVLVVNGAIGTDNAAIQGTQVSPTNPPVVCGIYGQGAGNGTGVYGDGTTGVYGAATTGKGVLGEATTGNGVYGIATAAGTTTVNAGVYGTSTATYGIIGNTTAAGYSGLTAITSTPNVAALGATSTVPNAYAAFFTGTTIVNGNFVATGGTKSAAVKDASGQHRLVYCVESPESWFEDFGTAKLVNGKADVTLDKTFGEIVHTDEYHVFLTETGGTHHHLSIERKGAGGFTVVADGEIAALKGKKVADLSGTFSYRVVAKRKDIVGERLAKFDMPKIAHPDPDKLPKPEPLTPAKKR